jgi:hypothetical protein
MCTYAGCDQGTDAGARAAAPVQIHCESASDCPIPSSTCDANGLVYYTNPYCAFGSCVWTRNSRSCYCSNGGCYSSTTTGALPNLPPDECVAPTCSGCTSCLQDCECRSRGPSELRDGVIVPSERLDASACATQCSEAGADGSAADGGQEGAADVVECTDQDLSKCELPPAQCTDANTLRYFDNASCVDGRCAWEQKTIACPCSGGGCQLTTTAGGTWSDSG